MFKVNISVGQEDKLEFYLKTKVKTTLTYNILNFGSLNFMHNLTKTLFETWHTIKLIIFWLF